MATTRFLDSLVADLHRAGLIKPPGGGTTQGPSNEPIPTPTPGFDFGLPGGGGGGGGGGTAPTGGGGGGEITPPGGSSSRAGGETKQGVPDNFERFPFYGGYFYDPSSGIIGYMQQSGVDSVSGAPTFTFHKLTKGERETFLNTAANEHPELFNGDSSLLNGTSTGAMSQADAGNLAARQAELAERAREARMQEAQAAADAAAQRQQAMMDARLAGAKYAVTPSMAASGYFPSLGPTSPLVRSGLAEPLSFQPSYFNPASVGTGPSPEQIARDLAAVRGAAGV